jgi:hypothetical protein
MKLEATGNDWQNACAIQLWCASVEYTGIVIQPHSCISLLGGNGVYNINGNPAVARDPGHPRTGVRAVDYHIDTPTRCNVESDGQTMSERQATTTNWYKQTCDTGVSRCHKHYQEDSRGKQ